MADQLNKLIEHQKVFMIDAHGQEENPNVRERLYDDTKYDLHFHKITNPISINGKKECTAEIRIPVNNPNREISIEIFVKSLSVNVNCSVLISSAVPSI